MEGPCAILFVRDEGRVSVPEGGATSLGSPVNVMGFGSVTPQSFPSPEATLVTNSNANYFYVGHAHSLTLCPLDEAGSIV